MKQLFLVIVVFTSLIGCVKQNNDTHRDNHEAVASIPKD